MKYFSATPVTCSRGKLFDAEIQIKIETGFEQKPKYIQKLLAASFSTREEATARARAECEKVEADLEAYLNDYLGQYKDARP